VIRTQRVLVAVLFPAVLVVVLVTARSFGSGDDDSSATVDISSAADETEFEHDFVIPAGTGDRLDAGDTVDVVPGELTVRVGEAIRIVNDDARGHQVGVFYVGAGESLTQRFNSPGTLQDECDVHSSGAFTLIVLPEG
jgi:plastocyanin